MYNKSEEKPLGKKTVRVVNPLNGKKYSVEFIVVRGSCTPFTGCQSKPADMMRLLSINRNSILVVETQNPGKSKLLQFRKKVCWKSLLMFLLVKES